MQVDPIVVIRSVIKEKIHKIVLWIVALPSVEMDCVKEEKILKVAQTIADQRAEMTPVKREKRTKIVLGIADIAVTQRVHPRKKIHALRIVILPAVTVFANQEKR